MRKSILALAVTVAAMGVAHAESNVQIYGIMDGGYVKRTGQDLGMGANNESRIGFRGSEDLGGGLKATLELERRFAITTGEATARFNASDFLGNMHGVPFGERPDVAPRDWQGAANVGLASNSWGAVRFGRVNNLGVETYRKVDPFNHYSVGAAITADLNELYSEQLSNTVRYDSPSWNGFSFGLSWTLAQNDKVAGSFYDANGNHGWNIGLQYDNGPLLLLGNFYRIADSDNSRVWNLGGAYRFGSARVSLGYQDTTTKSGIYTWINGDLLPDSKQKDAILGLQWDIGPGQLNAAYNYSRVNFFDDKGNIHKYSLGYTYNISKRTSLYGVFSYMKSTNDDLVVEFGDIEHTSVTSVQLGMTHRF